MLLSRFIASTILLIALMAAAAVSLRAQQQQCPEIKVFCPKNVTGTQTRCSAIVSGSSDANVTYDWSVSLPVPIQKFLGQDNEVGIDLAQFPGYAITVTVKIGGLPDGCPNTAYYEINSETKDSSPAPEPVSPEGLPPSATISCPEAVEEGTPAYFNAAVANTDSNTMPVYKWKVTSGRITSGQGTRTITVDTAEQGNQIIRAAVEISGLGATRMMTCATQVKAIPKAYKLKEYKSTSWEEEAVYLYRFFLRLKAGLDERAYIVTYGKRNGPKDEARRLAERARDYLVEDCGIDESRVEILAGGEREDATVELWVVMKGGTPPTPNPLSKTNEAFTSKKRRTDNLKIKITDRLPNPR